MLKVALFDEEHEKDLEEGLNIFLADLSEGQVQDIKFSVAVTTDAEGDQLYCYSALIIYREN